MLNMNRATLLGRAGRDPDVRDLKNGGRAATFSLATSEKWTDREGRPAEATEWHRVVVYGGAVDAVEKMLRKGDTVMVESLPRTRSGGRIATRGFRDREGNDRTITEIVVAGAHGTVNILGGRREADATQETDEDPGSGPGQAPGSGAGGGAAPEPGTPEDAGAAA